MTAVNVAENLKRVKHNIAIAARNAGRNPDEVGLIVVSKSVELELMKQAVAAGVGAMGESRVQELVAKYQELPGIRWHFIGHLQRNKVKDLVNQVELIHSLDRWSLAQELDRRARKQGSLFRVLVQVNVADEVGKFGLAPEEVTDFVRRSAGLAGLRVEGLMAMAPFVADPEESRPFFREMKRLFERLSGMPGVQMRFLSLGMSRDYTVAVEEGANLVRVGTAVFGPRKSTPREG